MILLWKQSEFIFSRPFKTLKYNFSDIFDSKVFTFLVIALCRYNVVLLTMKKICQDGMLSEVLLMHDKCLKFWD